MPEKGNGLQQFAGHKNGAGGQQAGKKFSRHQDLAPYRRQKIKVKAPVEDFAAKQIHENSQASEKDRQPQKKELEDSGEHDRVLAQVVALAEY